jgi:hypothetical protein
MIDRWRTRDAIRARRRLAALPQNSEQRGQGDNTDLDQQDDRLGGIHAQGSTRQVRGGYPWAPGKEVMSKAREVTTLNHALVERAEKGSPARGKPNAAGRDTLD